MVSKIIKSFNGNNKNDNNSDNINPYPTKMLYPAIVDKVNDGIIIIQNEKIKFVNLRSLETTGFSKEELVGQSIQNFVHPEYRNLLIERYEKRLKSEKVPERYEIAFISKTGRTIPVEIIGSLIDYENRPAVLAIINDITEKKKLENKTKQTKADYEQVVSSINTIVWKADVEEDGSFTNTYISPVADRLLGVEPGTIGSDRDKYFSYAHPDDIPEIFDRLEHGIRKGGLIENYEYRMIKPDGNISWFSSNAAVNFNSNGILQIFGTTVDITEKKKTCNQIIESEDNYRQVISSVDALVWKADVTDDGKFIHTYLSPVAKKMLGLETETIDLDWDQFLKYIHPDDSPNVIHNLKMMAEEQKTTTDYEYRLIRPDGTQLWLYEKGTAYVNSKGTLQIFGSTMDVTEKKRTQVMLKSERNRAQKYFDVAKVMMMVLDTEQKVVQINKKGCEIIGYPEDDIIGKNCEFFLPNYCKNDIQILLSRFLNKEEISVEYNENTILTSTGEEKIIAWHNSILRNENGDIEGMLCSGEDITVRKEAESNLINAKLAADAANRTKNEFMANVSHELRTPLNSVIGFSDVILNESFGPLNDKQKKYIDTINKNGKNLLKLINKILSLSAIEARSIDLNIEKVLLSEIPKTIGQDLKELAAKRNIEIKNNVDTTLQIEGDKRKMNQVMIDLMENAIKFTDPGGSITLSSEKEKDMIHLWITDTGIGISETEKNKLFSEFYQVDASSTRKYGGNGIGLSLVKYYVEMHKGKIWIESEEGAGTTVHLRIPQTQD
ncbi:PAS domain S-box protein [Methanococcoides sp. SA1]|nr:PAS domain S-box protein [Methanococcoides sp. SA1]